MFLAFQSPGPIMLELGPIAIRWYGFLIACGVVLGVTLAQWLAQKRGVDPDLVGDLVIWIIIGAIPGARIYYVAFEWENYAQQPAEILAIWHGGIAIHGAILGGLTAAYLFTRWQKVAFWPLIDLIAPGLILGQAIGRWGNFFNSEAFGRPTDLPWKLFIPRSSRPEEWVNFDYFHPTFLYESLWNLGVFALLMALFFWGIRKPGRLKVGTLIFTYFIAYSLGRFWIEGLRTDSLMFGPLRIAQIISLVQISLGGLGLAWLYVWGRSLPDIFPAKQD